jgi:DNA mismatch repair ATPase MutS
MQLVRSHLVLITKLHYGRQKQRWLLEAASVYGLTVTAFSDALREAELGSEGLQRLRAYLAEYTDSEEFHLLRDETAELEGTLADIAYMVHINGPRVRVLPMDDQADVSQEVQETFAKFAQGSVDTHLVRFHESQEMNHVDARILEGVAHLNPEPFEALSRFCVRRGAFADPVVTRFDREVQLYLAYLDAISSLRQGRLRFAEPSISTDKRVRADDTFDLALARRLSSEGETIVLNGFELRDRERVIVITGPNNGGKTTLARTVGQLHYLASLGLPVPARSAALFVPDQIFTLFEREEDIATLRGKFEDELFRMHEILERATEDSILVLNEAFGSTTRHDAIAVGSRIMAEIIDREAICVFVTFVDELASLSDSIVSMMSTVFPEDPSVRTFKVIRKPPDGSAYAAAIAEKYGLGHDQLVRRIRG